MKISWTTFKITDMTKSLEFYRDILELPVAGEINAGPRKITFLGEQENALELIEGEGCPENPGEGVSIGIVYDDLEKMIEKIKGLGINVIGPVSPNPHLRFFFVKDPDGYTVQLCENM